MLRVGVLGATGFVAGELLRLLHVHPCATVQAVASRSFAGRPLGSVHPHLREVYDHRFITSDDMPEVDVLFSAMPHGQSQDMVDQFAGRCGTLIDLAADFRLTNPRQMLAHYGWQRDDRHRQAFTYGLPELTRTDIVSSERIAVAGCMATASILALHPLAASGLLEGTPATTISVDARTGSSGGGASPGAADSHPLRRGASRVFAPLGHRHQAEIEQLTGLETQMTATGTDAVRGIQVVVRLSLEVEQSELWRLYRAAYEKEPFVRLVAQRQGAFRLPDPKVLLGSNFCDVGFDTNGRFVVVVAALDNLVKGAAGNAVQCMNICAGLEESLGLHMPGLHPV